MRIDYRVLIAFFALASSAKTDDDIPEALKAKDFERSGAQFVLSSETTVANQIRNVKTMQTKYLTAYRSAEQQCQQFAILRDEYIDLKIKETQTGQLLIKAVGNTAKTQAVMQAKKQIEARLSELGQVVYIEPPDLLGAFAVLVEVRRAYIAAIRESWKSAQEIQQEYAKLAQNTEIAAAVETASKSESKPVTLARISHQGAGSG